MKIYVPTQIGDFPKENEKHSDLTLKYPAPSSLTGLKAGISNAHLDLISHVFGRGFVVVEGFLFVCFLFLG